MNYSVLWNTEIQNQQAGAELKQIECTKPLNIGFFVAFFDTNNSAFRKTNSSGKTLDTRQKIFCAALLEGSARCLEGVWEVFWTKKFWKWTFCGPKTLFTQNSLNSKFHSKFCWTQNNHKSKFFERKIFLFFWPKYFLVPKIFWAQNFLVLKIFCTKHVLNPKFLDPKLSDQEFFWS